MTTDAPKALQVLNFTDNNYEIQVEAFKGVLDKAGNLPICVLVICGRTRTGKSYLLHHFVRYFEYKEAHPNGSKWYKTKTIIREKGPPVGMTLWSKPYIVHTTGGNLAVLLMHAQGFFDDRNTGEQSVQISSFSTLCSSVMIVNTMCFLEETTFEQVQRYSNYALLEDDKRTKLFFVVQDCRLPENEYKYGYYSESEKPKKSKKNYFHEFLRLKNDEESSEENILIRPNIPSNIKDISIFCLPHPGKDFVRKIDKKPDNDFQKYVILLIEKIARENLVRKNVLGEQMTAPKFLELIKVWADTPINNNIFPDVSSLKHETEVFINSMASATTATESDSLIPKQPDQFEIGEERPTSNTLLQSLLKNFKRRIPLLILGVVILFLIIGLSVYFGAFHNKTLTTDPTLNGANSNKPTQRDISKLRSDAKKNSTEIVEKNCGRILKIPTSNVLYLWDYKFDYNYGSNENCLWTIDNTNNLIRSRLTLKVKLISDGFKGNTGLYALEWNKGILKSSKIVKGKEYELTADGLYFSFTSDNDTSTEGTGFLVQITITHSEQKTYGSNLFYRNSSYCHEVFNEGDAKQISITVYAGVPINFHVNEVNLRNDTDLLVYEIHAMGKFEEKGRLTGKRKHPLSFPTTSPILLMFVSDSDHKYDGKRFEVTWTEDKKNT